MTGSFHHLLTLAIVSLVAYLIPDLLKCPPIYDQLLERLLGKEKKRRLAKEKVLLDGVIGHDAAAAGKQLSAIRWPENCLVVSLIRGGEEIVPNGSAVLSAGDQIVLLCGQENVPLAMEIIRCQCEGINDE